MTSLKGQVKFINKDQRLFYQALKKNVQQYFTDNLLSEHANAAMVWKSVFMLSAYIGSFALLLVFEPPFWLALGIWFTMGISLAGVGMSVMHDANHGAYSSQKWVNVLMGHTLNLAGGAVFNWKLQHNILHHTYTNIAGFDDDINNKGGMRFTPHHAHESKHKHQHIYAFILYSLITLYWVVAKDFVQYRLYRKNGVNAAGEGAYRFSLVQLLILKAAYFLIFLGLPLWVTDIPYWQIITGFIVMHLTGGLILSVIFQLAHTVEETQHPVANENDVIENSWAVHQMETTMNFAPGNTWLSWYIGGLNYQIEHHLFPAICHIHYPKLAPIVQKTAAEFGVCYHTQPTFIAALKSHIRHLKTMGKTPSLLHLID